MKMNIKHIKVCGAKKKKKVCGATKSNTQGEFRALNVYIKRRKYKQSKINDFSFFLQGLEKAESKYKVCKKGNNKDQNRNYEI